jgi:hypothetical protein
LSSKQLNNISLLRMLEKAMVMLLANSKRTADPSYRRLSATMIYHSMGLMNTIL